MTTRLVHSLLLAASAIAPLPFAAAPAAAQSVMLPTQDVTLSIGNGQLINVPGSMADVFVANDAVADVQVKSARQFYVFGKSGGTTTVYASNAAGDVIWSGNVRVGSNLDSVDTMLRLAMPEAQIGVSTMGTNTFLLTGTVKAPEDAAEAERLVQAYVGEKANVISRLRTATPLQVSLQVRIAEVSRSIVKNFGVNLTTIDGSSGFQFGIGQGRSGFAPTYFPGTATGTGSNVTVTVPDLNDPTRLREVPGTAVKPTDVGSTIAGAGKLFGVNILGALDAGETVGLVATLANPNLTAVSGETAEFLAGGEFPIPISQGLGATSVEYKKYGVSLAYTPTVLSNGRISLRVRPEVSELSSEGAVVLNNITIPALTVRRTETTVELGSGQSFMIAGLMRNSNQNLIRKMPGAGDLPILGSLFRSTGFQKGETELVIVVTPYLVNPVNANDIKLPTDGYKAADDLQRILGNVQNDGVSGTSRPLPTMSPTSDGVRPIGDARSNKSSKRDKRSARADAVKPGFNLSER